MAMVIIILRGIWIIDRQNLLGKELGCHATSSNLTILIYLGSYVFFLYSGVANDAEHFCCTS